MTNSTTSTPLLNDRLQPPKTADEKLMVAVRVRPLRPDEGPRAVHCIDDKTLVLEDDADKKDILRQKRAAERHYFYDRVFNEESNEEEVYAATCAPLVAGALRGYAGAVFAYGATGAGKTHTMTALMARTLHELYELIRAHGEQDAFEVKMSYLEIYNENIRDLLNPSSGHLELRAEGERAGGAPAVAGLAEVRARGAAEAARLLAAGDRARTAEATQANSASSRGHALLSVTVSRPLEGGRVLRGRLFLVDLAGSERAGARARRLEGAHINRSLLALGNCINALSGGARYVNYRDSKLTRLLREALGGRCRTVMVAHVAAGAFTRDTTRNTLIYAQRATHITNKVERDVLETPFHMSQYRTVIGELRKEISRLKAKMKEERPRSVSVSEPAPSHQLTAVSEPSLSAPQSAEAPPDEAVQLKALRHAIVSTFKEQMRLRRRLVELDSHLLGLALDAERQHAVISHWEARFNRLYKPMSQPGARLSTQQSYRRGAESAGERTEGEVAVAQAWAELAEVEREQERIRGARRHAELQLEQVRVRGHQLEEELPARISSSSERELLALVCRVHELEADKLALQGERAARAHQLRRRDAALQRRDAQRQLADEIITRQRHILEECNVQLTSELLELYNLYQQDIHASSYEDSAEMYSSYKLPPISTGGADSVVPWSSESSGSGRGSSSGGDSEPLGASVAPLRLPTIPAAPTPRPRTRYSYTGNKPLKRYSSDDSLITAPGNDLEQRNMV